jgi:hypothetical protein
MREFWCEDNRQAGDINIWAAGKAHVRLLLSRIDAVELAEFRIFLFPEFLTERPLRGIKL